jgi:3'-phosphoadenosine 5'-phosphosulfate sulfotransferase (PAPS reductase)/FAD synthetase
MEIKKKYSEKPLKNIMVYCMIMQWWSLQIWQLLFAQQLPVNSTIWTILYLGDTWF